MGRVDERVKVKFSGQLNKGMTVCVSDNSDFWGTECATAPAIAIAIAWISESETGAHSFLIKS